MDFCEPNAHSFSMDFSKHCQIDRNRVWLALAILRADKAGKAKRGDGLVTALLRRRRLLGLVGVV